MNTKKKSADLGIILLSINYSYRQPSLIEYVRASKFDFFEFNAITPECIPTDIHNNRVGQMLRLGRFLSPRELATYVSHLLAQTGNFSKKHEWTLILEDDAILNLHSLQTIASLLPMADTRPIFINLLPSNVGQRSGSGTQCETSLSFIEVEFLFSGAVGYIINRAASDLISIKGSRSVSCPADFPALFYTMRKFTPSTSNILVSHDGSIRSTIYDQNILPNNSKWLLIVGHLTGLTYFTCRTDYLNFSNYLRAEFKHRLVKYGLI